MSKRESALARPGVFRDPFMLLRQMQSEFDRWFDEPMRSFFGAPALRTALPTTAWVPQIDVFEKDNRLVTKIDLPGMKKEDVKVEVADGYLAISGERKTEAEEKKENYYRCEREYGSFYRAIPLPEGVKIEDVEATFTDGVLEVSMPLPAQAKPSPRRIDVKEVAKAEAKKPEKVELTTA